MRKRHSWPEGHWNWPVRLTHQHGVRAGQMIFTGGQVDLDADGNVRNPGNIYQQCDAAMAYLADVLKDLDAGLEDLVRLVVYFVGDAETESCLLKQLADILDDRARPVVNLIALPELCYPQMMIEIEGVAMRTEDGRTVPRTCLHLPDMPFLSPAFSHLVVAEDMIFTGDLSAIAPDGRVAAPGDVAAQTEFMMEQLSKALAAAGAGISDVVKLNVFYVGSGAAEDWEKPAKIRAGYFPDPGPAPTGMPVPRFPDPEVMTKIYVTAMRGEKTYAWPDGHWDWTTPLPYKHGNRCGQMIHVGGQVSLDSEAQVIDPGDMVAQTRRAMDNVAKVLADLGAGLDDVVKVTTHYQGNASAEALHENLLIRSNSYTEPGPATTGIPMPALVYPDMVIEIEVTAMVESDRLCPNRLEPGAQSDAALPNNTSCDSGADACQVKDSEMSRISHIELDDANLPPPTPEIEQERKVAMFDLIEGNTFDLPKRDDRVVPPGPYRVQLSIREKRLVFDIQTEAEEPAAEFHLSLSPFRQVVKDYWQICESYFDAVKNLPPGQIETIDMARRGIHNEGARVLEERLEGKAVIDNDTARRLFTLICVLHFGA
ncbi:hypothetical protein ROA7745_03555 [Roseovarius aestuarii]|uniref:UPF0262 protein ROA7745_03555 n=2 Tax=Roseovarius aestuarii TaxID=475083 RepID=A0A1X7BVP9_9RHOB|nr:hypothetical protein ROA7745_03555 [Roseovarius aestuarii]